MDAVARAHDAAKTIVLEAAPAEEFSFDGVWADVTANPDADLDQAIEVDGGSKLVVGGLEIPLLSAIIIPLALWIAKKVADKAAGAALDAIIARVRATLGKNRNHEGGTLSDADIERIAQALVTKIAASQRQ